jgi:hypothetical protein
MSPSRGSDLGEAIRVLLDKAGRHFQAARAPLDDIWTESTVRPWCSAGWFQRRATTSFYTTILEFRIERLKLPDDFEVEGSPD